MSAKDESVEMMVFSLVFVGERTTQRANRALTCFTCKTMEENCFGLYSFSWAVTRSPAGQTAVNALLRHEGSAAQRTGGNHCWICLEMAPGRSGERHLCRT